MLHALSTPVARSLALLVAVLTATGIYTATRDDRVTRRLVLHAIEEPDSIYLSAWTRGDVRIKYDGSLEPITFEMRAWLSDGCRWRATEKLFPIDDRTFAYSYEETIEVCKCGAVPYRKTPRIGTVTVEN